MLSDPLLEALRARLCVVAPTGQFALAFSGGFDSRFLAFCALRFGLSPRLLIATGCQIPKKETLEALQAATSLELDPLLVEFDARRVKGLGEAGRERCYVCKKAMFSLLLEQAGGLPLCDGTNASDLEGFRPGMRALKELGIHSPLAESAITKPLARQLARAMGLPNPEQASQPCLLTRFPYGTIPDGKQLELLARAEEKAAQELHDLIDGLRLRFPKPSQPILHIKLKQGKRLPEGVGLRLAQKLQAQFGNTFSNLCVMAVETLSGYFDRPDQYQ